MRAWTGSDYAEDRIYRVERKGDRSAMCNTCNGEGFIVTCIDDMCRGAGECMHGDGEEVCPECGGDDRDEDDYDYMDGDTDD